MLTNGCAASTDLKSRKAHCMFRSSASYLWQAGMMGCSGSFGAILSLLSPRQLELGPNRVVYEPHSKLVYVGYGGKDAGKGYGEIGIIAAKNDKHISDIKVVAHPSELLLDKLGTRLFVLVSVANRIQVIDTSKLQVVS